MAISAPTQSAQYANSVAVPPVLNPARDGGQLEFRYAKLTFTAAGFTTAAAGDLTLMKLPAGRIRVYSHLSRIICPIGTATADLDIGWNDYTKEDGTTQTGDKDGFAASLDVGGAAIDSAPTAAKEFEFNSKSGVTVVASFDTANSPAAGDLIVMLVYSVGA